MIDFANSWVFLLLPLPWLIRKILSKREFNLHGGLRVPFFKHLQQINTELSADKKTKRLMFAALIWTLLVVALAGPQWLGTPMDLQRSGRDILLAIDLSGSMEIPDMELNGHSVDRLQIVKYVANQFIHQREGDRIGLILFGTRAYLQVPLTFDLKTVQNMLDDASIGLPGPQTAIGDAIGLAVKHLKDVKQNSKVIILLTDGVSNAGQVTPLDAAKMANQLGIRIYTIGLGSNQMLLPGMFGPQVVNPSYDLDEKTLQKIAELTHGMYFRATNGQDLMTVYKQLDKLEPRAGEKEIFRPKTPLYPWPLGLALILSVCMTLPYLNQTFLLSKREEQNVVAMDQNSRARSI